MYMIRYSRALMLIRVGKEMMRVNSSFRMFFVVLISFNIRFILNIFRIRSSVGLKLLVRIFVNIMFVK